MNLNSETIDFIDAHRNDDVRLLALQARKQSNVDLPTALTQIAGWQAAACKIPSWHMVDGILYPPHLSLEQCSSEATALYKAMVVERHKEVDAEKQRARDTEKQEAVTTEKQVAAVEKQAKPTNRVESCKEKSGSLADLTGGFGIDCAFLSKQFASATYVERQEILCQLATHNFPLLGLDHISVAHNDAIAYLQQMSTVDWIFIDPARRDGSGGKTVAIADCEPNISLIEPLLLSKARKVMVKLSPMLDLSLAIQHLQYVEEVHIISVNNECKELLLILGHKDEEDRSTSSQKQTLSLQSQSTPSQNLSKPLQDHSNSNIPIHCINLINKEGSSKQHQKQTLLFSRSSELSSPCQYTDTLGSYLYEPNASILKAGAFRSVAYIYKVKKLHANSHLYTSQQIVENFPGRQFRITAVCPFSKKEMKTMLSDTKKANITVRNFPSTVAELRKRTKLPEGGDVYLFATTLYNEQKVMIKCERISVIA